MTHDFPPWQTIYRSLRAGLIANIWEHIHTVPRAALCEKGGRQATPRVGILDSQSVKNTCQKGFGSYDGAKKVKERERQAWVETQGLLLKVVVSPAHVQDTAIRVTFVPVAKRRKFV